MQRHEKWLRFAENDLYSAKRLNDQTDRTIVQVLYCAQQCAEKSLKSFLIFHSISYPKVHDLVELIHLCAGVDEEFYNLERLAAELTPFATDTRYPEGYFPILYDGIADEGILCAEKVLVFVKDKMDNPIFPIKPPQRPILVT